MALQTRTMISTNVCESVTHKRTVLQINQEWTITVQSIAHIHSRSHLIVQGRSQPARSFTNPRRWRLTNIVLPYLFQTEANSIYSSSLFLKNAFGKLWKMYSRRLIFKRIQERDYLNFPFSKHTEHMRSYYVTQFNHIHRHLNILKIILQAKVACYITCWSQ